MSIENTPSGTYKWKFTLTPGYFGALQAMSQEVLAREMKHDTPPSKSLQAIAGYSSDAPYFRPRTAADVSSIAEHLAAFARDTDARITDLYLDLPAEVAEPFVDERRKHGELAQELAGVLFADAEYVRIFSEEPTNVDDWAQELFDN